MGKAFWILTGGISMAFFVAAGLAQSDSRAFLLALIGAFVPLMSVAGVTLVRMSRWRAMGKEMGLVATSTGAYPDLQGRYAGRRLLLARRVDPRTRRPTTQIKLSGLPSLRLPGTVATAATVQQVLAPMLDSEGAVLPEHDAAGGSVQAGQETDDRAAIE